MAADNNGWSEWQNLVLSELKRLSSSLEKLEKSNSAEHNTIKASISKHKDGMTKDCNNFRTETAAELAELKVKSGIWGLLGGLIPAIAALLWFLLAA